MQKADLSQIYNRSLKSFFLVFALFIILPIVYSSPYFVSTMVIIGIFAIVCTGLTMLMGFAGQISLGHVAFYGIGAYSSAYVTVKLGLPALLGIIVGILVASLIAYIVGIPTLKLQEHYLALATLGFGIIIWIFFKQLQDITGGLNGFFGITYLEIFGFTFTTDLHYYYITYVILFAGILFARNIVQSRVGRALRSIHGSEFASSALGVDIQKYKLHIFVLSAGFASIAGSLYAHYIQFLSPQLFEAMQSIHLLIMVIIGGMHSIWGGLIGATVFFLLESTLKDVLPILFSSSASQIQIVFFGLLLVAILIYMPNGLAPAIEAVVNKVKGLFGVQKKTLSATSEEQGRMPSSQTKEVKSKPIFAHTLHVKKERDEEGSVILKVDSVTKNFGGVTAVSDVSLNIHQGEIVAVIGPNGAGKTTLFNMITNVLPLTSGKVIFDGQDTAGKKPFQLAEKGLGRTFQNLQIFDNMTVIENVMTGAHRTLKTSLFTSGLQLKSVQKEEQITLEKAMHLLEQVGLADRAYESAQTQSYGAQKLIEIARVAAQEPRLILLDEPMAGLNPQESRELVDIILKMRKEGMSFLFVEHDMETVMGISDNIVVLDYGKKIAEGTPEQISSNPKVIAAYLGEDEEEAI